MEKSACLLPSGLSFGDFTRKKIYIKVLEFDIGEGRRPLHTNDLSRLLTKHQNQLYSSEAALESFLDCTTICLGPKMHIHFVCFHA